MHLIIKILVDNDKYISSEIMDHFVEIVDNQTKLEFVVKNYIKDIYGKLSVENLNIIDVHSLDQVAEPLIDCVLIYRVNNDISKLHVYHRLSKTVSGLMWNSVVSTFKKIAIFELSQYNEINKISKNDNIFDNLLIVKNSEDTLRPVISKAKSETSLVKEIKLNEVISAMQSCEMFLKRQRD
uniref:Uncharacterized protein n=1 Tax=viral metagenome TaxID=1070528 RepID=A0A6C0LS69_9ZZZZ